MSEQVESEARAIGWRPQEEFRGDPEKWVDAETFLERGRTVLPILKKDNEKLHGTVQQLTSEVGQLKQLLNDSQESIKALMEFHDEDSKRRVEGAVRRVKAELSAAQKDGDHEAVAELTDQLVDMKAALKETTITPAKKADQTPEPKKDFSQEPWFKQWHSENSWYGSDMVKTAVANMVAERLRMAGDRTQNEVFLRRVAEETEKEISRYGGRPSGDRVEGGRGSGGGSGGDGGKTYADLPADAKQVCERQSTKMVGEGRVFKTKKDWQTYYTNLYFKE